MAARDALPVGRTHAQVERVGARLQPGAPARPDVACGHSRRRLAQPHRHPVHDSRCHDAHSACLVTSSAGAPGSRAEGLAGVLPQARGARRRARAARRTARLLAACGARAARLAARHSAHRLAVYRLALRLPGEHARGSAAAAPGARAAAHVKRVLAFLALISPALAQQPGYAERPEVRAFVRELVERHGFVERELLAVFARAQRSESVLQAAQAPAERRPWEEYRATFLTERRIADGAAFWNANRKALERAEHQYGVPPEYVVAILGVETFYGRNTGRWRVVDALTTLAFDYPPRAPYFRDQLEQYLLLVRDGGIDVFSMRGSYAGAIGIPQFMPSSTRRFAVDFNDDGVIDLRRSAADAIGSVANFLKQHGWERGGAVALEARVTGDDYRAYTGGLEAKNALAELIRAGVQPLGKDLPGEARAALVELETPDRPSEYRIGLTNS